MPPKKQGQDVVLKGLQESIDRMMIDEESTWSEPELIEAMSDEEVKEALSLMQLDPTSLHEELSLLLTQTPQRSASDKAIRQAPQTSASDEVGEQEQPMNQRRLEPLLDEPITSGHAPNTRPWSTTLMRATFFVAPLGIFVLVWVSFLLWKQQHGAPLQPKNTIAQRTPINTKNAHKQAPPRGTSNNPQNTVKVPLVGRMMRRQPDKGIQKTPQPSLQPQAPKPTHPPQPVHGTQPTQPPRARVAARVSRRAPITPAERRKATRLFNEARVIVGLDNGEARKYLLQALRLLPRHDPLYPRAARLFKRIAKSYQVLPHRYAKPKRRTRKRPLVAPKNPPNATICTRLLGKKQYRAALDCYKAHLRRRPNNTWVYVFMGIAAAKLGRCRKRGRGRNIMLCIKSESYYREYLKLHPKGRYAKQIRAILPRPRD